MTETVTVEAAPEPASEDSFSDEEINDIAIQFAWDNLSYDEQEQACLGIMLDEDMMIDAFMEGAGGSFDEQQVREFFREVCGI